MTLAFATNQDEINLEYIIPTYKGRWRIETGFQVQDEARIKSKSKDMRIRFFYFVYEQMLQLLWVVLYKEELSFKAFVIEMRDEQRKGCASREKNCYGQRIDIKSCCVDRPLKHQGFNGSISTWWFFFSKKQKFSPGILNAFVNFCEFGDTG